MYKLIVVAIYTIIDDYICLYYLGLFQGKWSKHDSKFEYTKFKNLYVLVIPDILMNIMSCHAF